MEENLLITESRRTSRKIAAMNKFYSHACECPKFVKFKVDNSENNTIILKCSDGYVGCTPFNCPRCQEFGVNLKSFE